MYTTINKNRLSSLITRTAAVTLFAASATLVSYAQQSAGTSSSLSPISLQKTLAAPLDLTCAGRSQLQQQRRRGRDGHCRELQFDW